MHATSTSQSNTVSTQRVHPSVLRCLALTSVALAIPAFAFAFSAFSRKGAHYLSGTISAALIGSILLIAAFCAFKGAGRKSGAHASAVVNRPLRAAALLISLPALFGGFHFLWMSALLLNQEYLQWFPTPWRRSFGDHSIRSMLLDFLEMGAALTSIGFFLLWFALFKIWHLSPDSPPLLEVTDRPGSTPTD